MDADVVVPAVVSFSNINPDELWIASWYWIQLSVHTCSRTGCRHKPKTMYRCTTLPIFHALTECDTVSSFAGIGKKTAWEIWKVFPEVTDAFKELLRMPSDVSEESMSHLERFVVLMYNRTSNIMEVNDARKQLFAYKSTALYNIPPMQAVLWQHIKRACLQANTGTRLWS